MGSALIAKAPPDGYTLLVADNGTHAIAPTLYGAKLSYDVFKDFTPITLAATFPTVIMSHPSVPAQERLAKLGLIVVASPQGGLADVLQRDVPKWGKAVKDSGAVAE